ncbi:VWA domain-containing protein [Micromonospora sp. WMMD718]|uniref:VWA domain-containing protein n=1 Tax=unclassified Micromonospora TaxID=2617518 RepID=UPI00064C3966|nr:MULTISPECIES: VWA domain-containing protein [unclassified Micromonospora]MDG4755765.1 VWA domain-containing protein [Micromonospora sp. WMMD718]
MSHPSTHLQQGAPPTPAGASDWHDWSAAWTQHVPLLTGRTDLTVLVAPGAAGDAPECFYPALNRIEVDATYIADRPDVTDPTKARHKRIVPTGYGLLVHGAAHAAHSRWTTPPGTRPILAAVADMLEESRAEGRQRARRRGDRRWLRHVVTTLLDPEDAAVDDAWHAGQLAALLLARVDARIVTSKDVRPVRAAVTGVLGRKRLRQLRDIWREAHTCDDTDADTMICLARRWCQVLGIDADQQYDTPVPDAGLFPGRLAAALVDYLAVAAGVTPAEYAAALLAYRHSPPSEWDRRDPTEQEHHAARDLANRLRQARTQHPEPGRRPSAIPPGRLRTRQAITAEAQIAAGQLPTAAPWQQRAQLPPEKPRLHLAVLVDLSGSMDRYTDAMSSAAWIFANAARRADATTTTIGFGDRTTVLVPPRTRPTQVLTMRTGLATATFPEAVKVADQLLDLRHGRTLRMLAVVSDGYLDDIPAGQQLVTTLHQAGCAVLWLHPADPLADSELTGTDQMWRHTFTHTTTLTVADPVEAVAAIADAAVAALAQA